MLSEPNYQVEGGADDCGDAGGVAVVGERLLEDRDEAEEEAVADAGDEDEGAGQGDEIGCDVSVTGGVHFRHSEKKVSNPGEQAHDTWIARRRFDYRPLPAMFWPNARYACDRV